MGADNPQKAKYKSPTGRISTFDYEDLEHSFTSKSGVFENASGNGTYVQGNGVTGIRAPMACIFHGNGYDKAAKYFMASLSEPGVGVLYHPVYDKEIYVKAVGDIVRSDQLLSGRGQVTVTVQFYETAPLKVGKKSDVGSVFDEMFEVVAADFAAKAKLDDAPSRESFKNRINRMLATVKNALKKASGTISKANSAIDGTADSMARGIDIIVGEPLALARQTQILIGEPMRQKDRIKDKLAAYRNLAGDIFSQTLEEPNKYSSDYINQFHMDNVIARSIIANSAMLAMETGDYVSRSDYFNQAISLIQLADDYQEWNDANYAAIVGDEIDESEQDTGNGLYELLELVRFSSAFLLENADQTKTKVSIRTISERTPIDLCYQLYGTAEFDTLDMFVMTNEIVGDEMFLIPTGREIVYFV